MAPPPPWPPIPNMAAIDGLAAMEAIEAIDMEGFAAIEAIDTAVEYEVGGSDIEMGVEVGVEAIDVATEEAAAAPRELRRAPNGLLLLLKLSGLLLSSLTTGLTGMAGLARAASAADDDEEMLGGTGVCHGLDLLDLGSGWADLENRLLFPMSAPVSAAIGAILTKSCCAL